MSRVTPVVFVVDADAASRESVEDLLVCAGLRPQCFGSATDFLARPRACVPSCLVLDVNLEEMDGLELQARVTAECKEMSVVFFTGCPDVATTVRAMKAGAFEYLRKSDDANRLLTVVRKALDQSFASLASEAELHMLRARLHSLTLRERQVMLRVVAGRLNKQVASELGISEITVKSHRGRMMRKMQAASLAHLISMAMRLQLAVSLHDQPNSKSPGTECANPTG